MRKIKSYIPSLILAFIMVFALIGSSAVITVSRNFSSENLTELADENQVVPKIKDEINKYFSAQYYETGIPADVYTSAVTDEYIDKLVKKYSREGFLVMKENWKFDYKSDTQNPELEQNITSFFEEYAESINYKKDANYDKKLSQTIDNAYNIILDYCDIYKMKTLNSEGILAKASPIYQNISIIIIAALACIAVIIILLLIINRKAVSDAVYWIGASSLVAGIMGIIPCIYLNSTNFFDSFVIKQQQIFTSFTSLMYKSVNSFMINNIILAAVGLILILVYSLTGKKNSAE